MSLRIIKFQTKYIARGGQTIAEDWVEYCQVGMAQRSTTEECVNRLARVHSEAEAADNPAIKMALERWRIIEPAYKAWKDGQDVPLNGTPLGAWPGLTAEQADVLKMNGLKTVEELANASDSIITHIPLPNMRALRDMAKLFLASSDRAKTASDLADMQRQNDLLREEQEELRRIILEMQAERDAKPRRGRPPKADADDIEAVA